MSENTKTQQEVLELAHKHGLRIQPDSLQFNKSGLDFEVVLATDSEGKRWILRFPRREDVLQLVDKEKRTLFANCSPSDCGGAAMGRLYG